jgi:hypothetical protein
MAEFVSQGGFFDLQSLDLFAEQHDQKPSPLIQINVFEDGSHVVMDGHHRCVSIWEADRHCLDDSEYQIHELTYGDFLNIDFEKGWVTPYDPRTHVRWPELRHFKNSVITCVELRDEETARKFIRESRKLYSIPRTISTIEELHDVWKQTSGCKYE